MKRLLLILCAMLMGLSSLWAQRDYDFSAINSDGKMIYYNITDSINHEVEVAQYPDESSQYRGVINIPNSVMNNGTTYSVTTIGWWAFSYCMDLISVVIPSSVTTIGKLAFENCSNLTSVIIPSSVTTIEYGVFSRCTGLNSVTVESIVPPTLGPCAFENVFLDIPIYVPNNSVNSYKNDYDWHSFTNIKSANSRFPIVNSDGQTIYYNIVDSINHKVEVVAFPDTNYYSGVINIPSSISYSSILYDVSGIGIGAFRSCRDLTSVTIPNSVKRISRSAFRNSSDLTSITISNAVTEIGESAFKNCSSLISVVIPNSVTTIGESAFEDCSSLTAIEVPMMVTTLKNYVFWGCSNLTSVTIPNTVTRIGDYVFYKCISLTSITIPNSVTTIGGYAFSGDTNLHTVYWNAKNVIDYGYCDWYVDFYHPFKETRIKTVIFGDSVQTIPNRAFDGFTTLDSLVLGSSVTRIGENAFLGCSGVTTVSIPNSVETIGEFAFSNCSGVTSLTIGNMVTTIENKAFKGCTSMTNVIIGSNVISIGDEAFANCTRITSLEVKNQIPPLITNTTFENVRQGIPVYVPCSSLESYQADNNWSYFTNFQCGAEIYQITVQSNNDAWGTVTGGGSFEEGETARLTATANEGYHFVSWNDGNTENPRTITVTEDVTYVATFAADEPEGVDDVDGQFQFSIYPNPAHSATTISLEGVEGKVTISVIDMNGRVITRENIECGGDYKKRIDVSNVAQGTYFVRVLGENINSVRKLIIR